MGVGARDLGVVLLATALQLHAVLTDVGVDVVRTFVGVSAAAAAPAGLVLLPCESCVLIALLP